MTTKCPCTGGCYSDKTLVGDWENSRARYQKRRDVGDMYTTTFKKDFCPKPLTEGYQDFVWDEKLKSQGNEFVSSLTKYEKSPNYYQNYTTTYDLTFNHFPKMYKSYIPRTLRFRAMHHIPSQEYLKTYGNLTSYGLTEAYKKYWEREGEVPRFLNSTEYRELYDAYEVKYYQDAHALRKDVIAISQGKAKPRNPITWEDIKVEN
ncbi:uncharacterized protein LOC109601726 [Aethina tumida]|uniref:uncharacterized protein LOC109601726 n=1 Tax=Aethina tumida TaxID=116153 RepID=UPI00096AF0DE|nr:uncharacterized protein LOC109601726 [Aethina tumida]